MEESPVGPALDRRPGREGIDDAALRLFVANGVAGTSLQMIADALGLAKSAIYYHYRAKDDIVLGVLMPLLDQLPAMLSNAKTKRTRNASADAILIGLVDLVMRHGHRLAVLLRDPNVSFILREQQWLAQWWAEVTVLLSGPDPTPEARLAASMLLSSMGAPFKDPTLPPMTATTVRAGLIRNGRRLLRLPASRSL